MNNFTKSGKLRNCDIAVFIEAIFDPYYIYMFFSLKAFKMLVFEVDQYFFLMQKSVLGTFMKSGESKISFDGDEKSVKSAELLGIHICDFKDASSIEDGMGG